MSHRDIQSLYDYSYEDQDNDEPYIYSPNNAYNHYDVNGISEITEGSIVESIPHRLEDTVYDIAPQAVPFYGATTNKQEYTWKIPNPRERSSSTPKTTEKVPFYSETTHRSQYPPIDMPVHRARLSRRTSIHPVSNVPFETQTTYRNLFQELQIGKRQKLIQTCPAEKLMHQTAILRKNRQENGHFFFKFQESTNTSQPPLLKKPAQQD